MKELYENVNEHFPIEIDLGKSVDSTISVSPSGAKKSKKKEKYYPGLYASGISGLSQIPKEGHALIYFKRKRLGMNDKDETEDIELEITSICLPEPDEEVERGELEDGMKKVAKENGVDIGEEDEDDEDEDESAEEGEEDEG